MRSSRTNTARIGAVAGFAALAMVVSPALGAAAVTGTATVAADNNKITVTFTGVGSPTLLSCWTQVGEAFGSPAGGSMVFLIGGQGTYVSERLRNGDYLVTASCLDGDGVRVLTPLGGQRVRLDADVIGSPINLGSVTLDPGSSSGSLQDLFGS